MNRLPTSCPICTGPLVVESIHCRQCDTVFSGSFEPTGGADFAEEKMPILRLLAQLSVEQLTFLESFVRNEGKLNRMQEEVGLSYPTLRARLDEMLKALGYTPREEEKAKEADRRHVLDELQAGRISAAEAAELLKRSRG